MGVVIVSSWAEWTVKTRLNSCGAMQRDGEGDGDASGLEQTLGAYFRGSLPYRDALRMVRAAYARLLLANEPIVMAPPLRGRLWLMALGVDGFIPDIVAILAEPEAVVAAQMAARVKAEVARVSTSRGEEINAEDFTFWLTLCSCLCFRETGEIFEQNIYMFGAVLLRNMRPISAWKCFTKLISRIRRAYLSGSGNAEVRAVCGDVLAVLDVVSPETAESVRRVGVEVVCYARLASLFTQMSPLSSVDLLWDFLLLFGPDRAVYVEVAWLVRHAGKLKLGDDGWRRLRDPQRLVVAAVEALMIVSRDPRGGDIEGRIRQHFYG